MKLHDDKGMALVMALSVVLIMVTVAMHLHSDERGNMLTAAAMRDRITLDQMTISGIHLAMAVLAKDAKESKSDSLQEDWADEETMNTLLQQIPFENGKLSVKIIDEMGKIQINALIMQPQNQYDDDVTETSFFNEEQKKIWTRMTNKFFLAMQLLDEAIVDLEETDQDTILFAIKDWLDKDDVLSGANSAESDDYEALDPPYKCKNGPIDHLSEVQLIKGITPELYNGIGELGGIGDYITVYGAIEIPTEKKATRFEYPGQVNINTADVEVLKALMPEGNEGNAETLAAYREAINDSQYINDLTNIGWYKTALQGDGGISEELITVSSNIFRIVATAELDTVKATTTAVVRREQQTQTSPWRCKVLNWETE